MQVLHWLDENKTWLAPGGLLALVTGARKFFWDSSPLPDEDVLRCSFCNKSQEEVRKMIAANSGVYICEECVDLSTAIIDDEDSTGRAESVAAVCRISVKLERASLHGREHQELLAELDLAAHNARPTRRPRAGDEIAGAILKRIVGAGSFGTVWEADADDGPVAVKVFDPDKIPLGVMLWRFQRGIRAMQHLTNLAHIAPPSICLIHSVSSDRLGFTMDYLAGGDLTRLANMGWSGEKKRRSFAAIAEALSFAHEHGIVHRDVKPANIVISDRGNAVLTDFDIADLTFSATNSVSHSSLGTPHFAAPEQLLDLRESSHPTADIFSLGKLVYFLVTERPPPMTSEAARLAASGLDRNLRRVVTRCTAHDPGERYQSVDELLDEIPPAHAWEMERYMV